MPNVFRSRERWWYFGRCPHCRLSYSDWFVTGAPLWLRYCWPCEQREKAKATEVDHG